MHLFLKKPEIMHFFFPFDSLFNKHVRLNFFFFQGHINLHISRTMRFILPFFFSLYDEYVCFFMLISYNCLF